MEYTCPVCKEVSKTQPDYMNIPMNVTQMFDKTIVPYTDVKQIKCKNGHMFFINEQTQGKHNLAHPNEPK